MEKNNLYTKLNAVRLELSKSLEKSGKNNYSHYNYFQLKDFMPLAIKLCNEQGLFTKFWIDKERIEDSCVEHEDSKDYLYSYIEYAHVLVIDTETGEKEEFKKETANCALQGAQPIQNLGSKSTYMKRYMYFDVFEINENDEVEEQTGKPVKVETTTKKKTEPKVVSVMPVKTEPVIIEEAPLETKKEEVASTDLMSMDSKIELSNKIKEKGLDPRDTIIKLAKKIDTDITSLKESDKIRLLDLLEKGDY